MRIATWNVNSIRSRLEQVKEWIKENNPDVLCLQETKVENKLFPKEDLEIPGYEISFHGQKAYNGVALISRHPILDVKLGLQGELKNDSEAIRLDEQKRIISAFVNGIRVVNVYVPNGSSLTSEKYTHKLIWLQSLKKYLQAQSKRNEPLCLVGDFNIALEANDIHNPDRLSGGIMASEPEREQLRKAINGRLQDVFRLFETKSGYWSWWDYRSGAWDRDKGWRIDHIYLSEDLILQSKSALIDKKVRGNIKPSDHAPVMVDIDWPATEDSENEYQEDIFDIFI